MATSRKNSAKASGSASVLQRRDAITQAAAHLFAEQGYAKTTIAEVSRAAGLSPGAGGIYRHFASKEELLAAVVDDALAQFDAVAAQRHAFAALDADLNDKLRFFASTVLDMLEQSRPLTRVLATDLAAFPHLLERVRERLVDASYAAFADWLRDEAAAGRLHAADPDALAVVMLGALFNLDQVVGTLGAPPGGLDRDRFVRAWAHTCAAAAGAAPTTSADVTPGPRPTPNGASR